MSEITDLDILLPEPKKIKLSGKVIELYPGKLKTLIKLQKSFLSFRTNEGDPQLFQNVVDALSELIPALKEDDFDITIPQLSTLVELAYKVSMPENSGELKQSTEKKTE